MCVGRPAGQLAVWEGVVLSGVLRTVTSIDDRKVLECTSMLLTTCVRDNQERLTQLSEEPNGQALLRWLLASLSVEGDAAHDGSFDWIFLLIKALLKHRAFGTVYKACQKRHERRNFLNLVDSIVSRGEELGFLTPPGRDPIVTRGGVDPVLFDAVQGLGQDTGGLLLLLQLIQEEGEEAGGDREAMVWSDTLALAAQVLASLATGLTGPQRDELVAGGAITIAGSLLGDMSKEAKTQEHHNLACSMIRIIGNVSYRHTRAQDSARERGVLTLLLQHCELNIEFPFKREWSMMAIRNLCEGNEATQEMLSGLQNLGPAPNAEQGIDLDKMGIKVEVDGYGKVKVVDKDGKDAKAPTEGEGVSVVNLGGGGMAAAAASVAANLVGKAGRQVI